MSDWYYVSSDEYEKKIYEWQKKNLDIISKVAEEIRSLCECDNYSIINCVRNLIQAYDEKDNVVKKIDETNEKANKVIEKALNEIIDKYELKKIGRDLYSKHLDVEFHNFLNLYRMQKLIYDYDISIVPFGDDKVQATVRILYNNLYVDGSIHTLNFLVK